MGPTSQGPLWFATCCYLWPQGRLGMEIFICRGRAGARGGRGGRCHLCLDRDVFRIWNGNRRTHWNPSASSCFMTQNCFSLLPSYHHSVPPCPSLAAPAVSRRRPYLRATENLAVHVNYISGSLPRALQLSFHIKKKKRYYAEIN